MVALFLFFLVVAVMNKGALLSGLNTMSAKERERYNIPLISKIVGINGMLISISIMVLFYIGEEYKWIGWIMVAASGIALIVFALITSIDDGKYVQKKC